MRAPVDLHPDDRAARLALRDLLIDRRLEQKLTQDELATRMGVTKQAVSLLESSDPRVIHATQRWSRPLNCRLTFDLVGLPVDPNANGVDAFRPTDPGRADLWDQRALAMALRYAREELGLSQKVIGRRLGGDDKNVRQIELQRYGLIFTTPQRYARVLGGRLDLGIEVFTAMGSRHRPDPTRPRPDTVDRTREDCAHPAEYRQPGGLCGCCGWDGFGVAGADGEIAKSEMEEMV